MLTSSDEGTDSVEQSEGNDDSEHDLELDIDI